MTFYRRIEAVQSPTDFRLDDVGRQRLGFNIDVSKNPSNTFLEELVKLLEVDGVGTREVTIFASSSAHLPKELDAAPFLTIEETGGRQAGHTHNETLLPANPHPSARLVAHARYYMDARTLINNAYTSLVKVRNTDLSP